MKVGRPTKFNPERAKNIIAAVSNLVPYSLAAESNGINRATLSDWINTGLEHLKEGKKTALAEFSSTLKKCECEAIIGLLDDIKAGVKSWQSRAWILERRFPTEFAVGAHELVLLRQELDEIKKVLNDG
ncbi:hypothetical protein [Rickettsiella endosymbiont of Dermanyssus gallinae]|uniref:hypothetical protein n=1 Tax=Rickettsiella endosymbiont of Dermanyssus gallinae TaxID=2856608 RepID=UPI001C5340C4|nr:hypothetical protein [Rickettsiella endosymbiont of Dermanyssus gallinae]